jgi:hypothetical protein
MFVPEDKLPPYDRIAAVLVIIGVLAVFWWVI